LLGGRKLGDTREGLDERRERVLVGGDLYLADDWRTVDAVDEQQV
jgi:hypothetical protein